MLQGGTRSGKTRAVMDYLLFICCRYSGLEIDVCRSEFSTLRGTAYSEFKKLLIQSKVIHEHNKSENIITINGNTLSFYGLDNDEKVHGKERDILWVNEINQIRQEVFDQLTPRTRYRIIGDYNPRLGRKHWLDKYIQEFPPIITTYLDNPFLPDIQVQDIESKRDNVYWWSIYGEGKRAAMQGAIFENWEFGEFDKTLTYCYGQDFGFNPDPTTLIKVAIDKRKKIIYMHECFYNANQLTTDQIFILNKNHIERIKDLIVADSAEPRLIHEVAAKGLNIQKTTKGAGSVLYGINKMLEYKIIITPESFNLETELNNYIWNDKKSGIPIDKYNHCIDSARYAFARLTTNPINQNAVGSPQLF